MNDTMRMMQHLRNIAVRDAEVARASRRAARYGFAAWVAEEVAFTLGSSRVLQLRHRLQVRAEGAVDVAGRLASEALPEVLA